MKTLNVIVLTSCFARVEEVKKQGSVFNKVFSFLFLFSQGGSFWKGFFYRFFSCFATWRMSPFVPLFVDLLYNEENYCVMEKMQECSLSNFHRLVYNR